MVLQKCLALALFIAMLSSAAQTPAPRAAQHGWREAAAFLMLSNEQWAQLRVARAEHDQQMAQLASQARQLHERKDEHGLRQLCQRSRLLASSFRDKLRPTFTPQQLERLAQLEQAFTLMPIVQSAQSAGLIADRLLTSPEGLPQQQVELEVSWQRVTPPALPGCPAQEMVVRPGTVDERGHAPVEPQKPTAAATSAPRSERFRGP